ncbi:hypothetical protein BU17DRAFT_84992 [Hysterangium stoloniferum]|nr:hypothetical protein BU17DRAFT_84992 [Hysterangium stoloniferum]
MHKRVAVIPPSQVRPTKRRRRTATEVLAGHFDPRPQRDFFTDMANIKDTTSAFNSILGHGPGVVLDVRTNEEKRMNITGVQNGLAMNHRQMPRETGLRRSLDEHIFRNAQRQVDHVIGSQSNTTTHGLQDQTQVASGSSSQISPQLSSSVEILLNPPVNSSMVLQPRDRLLARSVNSETAPSHREQLHCPTTSADTRTSLHSLNSHTMRQTSYSAEKHPHPPTSNYYPTMTPITMAAAGSSACQMASPPTPARSVASFTTNTSSRRPRTPEDDGETLLTQLGGRHENSEKYDSYTNSRDDDALLLDVECRGKYSYRGPSSDRESSRGDMLSPDDQDFAVQPYSNNPNWRASPPLDIRSERGWVNGDSAASPATPLRSPVQNIPSTPPSFAHRRNALSLAGLLSPSAEPCQPSGVIAIIPPTPEVCVTPRPTDPPVNEGPAESPFLSPAVENMRVMPSVSSMSTIDSPCVSPLDASADTNSESFAEEVSPSTPIPAQGNFDTPSIYIDPELNAMEDVSQGKPRNGLSRREVAYNSGYFLDVPEATPSNESREMSDLSDYELRQKGKRSKAMLVIESDDSDSETEDGEASRYGQKYYTQGDGTASSAFKVKMLEGSSARREENVPDALPFADRTPSPVVRKGIPKKKRAAVKKGWKGWVEVEVDESHRPAKQFSLDTLPSRERRTRSGKQFDA